MSEITIPYNEETITETPVVTKSKRGRKPKYATDEERKEAKRLQNKAYRERKKQLVIHLGSRIP